MNHGDRILVTMPRSAPREGEYVEDRGSRARVLLDGDTETCVVLRERVKPVLARVVSMNHETRTIVMGEPEASTRAGEMALRVAAHRAATKHASGVPDGARCSVAGCKRMRGYYLNECYEHAGPDPYADDEPAKPIKRTEQSTTDAVDAMIARGDDLTMVPAVWHTRAVPKPPKPWRSDAYRAFVRTFECCGCGMTPTEAHHHGPHAMGQKTDDSRCIPLCVRCHRGYHDTGEVPSILAEFQDEVTRRAQIECLRAWFALQEMDADTVIVEALINHLRESQT